MGFNIAQQFIEFGVQAQWNGQWQYLSSLSDFPLRVNGSISNEMLYPLLMHMRSGVFKNIHNKFYCIACVALF